jgi:hypothetical protein
LKFFMLVVHGKMHYPYQNFWSCAKISPFLTNLVSPKKPEKVQRNKNCYNFWYIYRVDCILVGIMHYDDIILHAKFRDMVTTASKFIVRSALVLNYASLVPNLCA